jgi:hypothetical protein
MENGKKADNLVVPKEPRFLGIASTWKMTLITYSHGTLGQPQLIVNTGIDNLLHV